jgi:hypothetical protein
VGVYEILPSNCMRKAYYHRKLAFLEPSYSIMPYSVRGRAVESAIARMLFAQT